MKTTKAPRHQKNILRFLVPWCLGGKRVRRRAAQLGLILLLITPLSAAPTLKALEPIGAQRGRTFMLTLVGQDLRVGSELLTTIPGTISRLAPPKDLQVPETELPFLVQLRPDAPVGAYPIRVRNADGISNVLLFSVGDFPEIEIKKEAGPASFEMSPSGRRRSRQDEARTAYKITPPVVVNSALKEGEQDFFSFNAAAGETLVFEVEARRIGSGIDPAIQILDASGREIAFNDDAPLIGADCRVQVKFPRAGEYRAVVHDARFSNQEQNFYRLKVGNFLFAEAMFPLGWERGKEVDLTFFGGNLTAPITAHTSLNFPPSQALTLISVPSKRGGASLPVPFMLGSLPEVLEPSSPGPPAPTELQPDTVVNGRISRPGESPWYRLPVKPGEKWLFEVAAASLGTSPLQACLNIYDRAKKLLLSAVDADTLTPKAGFSFGTPERGVDPRTIFEVPEKVNELFLSVEDLNSGGGPGHAYRLRASRQWEDFQLELAVPYINIPAGGTAAVLVRAVRTGYQGPIKLTVPNAGDALVVDGGNIPEKGKEGLLTITARQDPEASRASRDTPAGRLPKSLTNLEVWGEATLSSRQVIRRRAAGPGLITPVAGETGVSQKPVIARWLGMELPAGVSEATPLQIEPAERQVKVVQGLKHDLKVKVSASTAGSYPIRVSARLPSGTGLNARTVTLMPPKDARAEPTYQGSFQLGAEFDTPTARFDMVLEGRAEQPGRGTALSRAITVDVVRAYALQLPSQVLEAPKDSLAELAGKLIREAPFGGEVTVHIEDLPKGIAAKPVTVASEASDFRLQLEVGSQAEPGEYEIRLVSSGKMEGRKDKAGYSIPDVKMRLKVRGE